MFHNGEDPLWKVPGRVFFCHVDTLAHSMSLLDDFLLAANDEIDALFGTVTMTCAGQSFSVVWNDERKGVDGELGGLEPNVQAIATAQPADVTNPKAMLNKQATINGTAYRVNEVTVGTIAVHFSLSDPNESR